MTPILYPYAGQDTAADWQPVTAEPPQDNRQLVTYDEWLAERRQHGIPGDAPFIWLAKCNWHGPNWLGATCPACGAIVWERRGGRLDCHTCEVWWGSYDEMDAAAAMLAAADETTE